MQYNREKTFAVITGLICALITLSATLLGVANYIRTMGWFGIFPSLGLFILDMVIIWAAYIDYKEDGTLLEYASWGVKYVGALYLLLYGGMLAFVLATEGKQMNTLGEVARLRNTAFSDCLKKGGSQKSCRELHSPITISEDAPNETFESLKQWSDSPAPKVIGPLLGIIGLVILSLISKLTSTGKLDLESATASYGQRYTPSPFTAPSESAPYPPVYDSAKNKYFRFRNQGKGVVVLHKNNSTKVEKYCLMISKQEATIYASLPYPSIVAEIIKRKPELTTDIRG